jgi:hypothetical protein
MTIFPRNPADQEEFVFGGITFVFFAQFDAWLPAGITEPKNTLAERDYENVYLHSVVFAQMPAGHWKEHAPVLSGSI